jgi:hypothetical protein
MSGLRPAQRTHNRDWTWLFAVAWQLQIGEVRRLFLLAAMIAVWVCLETPALACPSCPTSRVVMATVCGDGFWRHLTSTAAPFVVFGIVAWRLNRIGRGS